MSVKLISFWVLGAVLLVAGAWIINNLELVVGVPEPAYIIALLIAFVLFLVAGLCWISVSVATRKRMF